MNSTDRIRSVIRFQQADRPPVIPELIAVTATLTGAKVKDYVQSGQVMAQCQLETARRVGGQALFAMADLCVEAEALGCPTHFPDDNYPHIIEPILKSFADLKKIRAPDPHCDGRMPRILEAVRILKKESDGMPVLANAVGPITLASRIMDIEKMLYLIVDEPDKFDAIIAFCEKVSTAFALELVKAGADGILVFDPTASPSVLPAKIFRQFEANRVKNLFSAVKRANPDIITWYSVAGPVQTNPAILTDVAGEITTVDYLAPIETAIRYSGYTVINGNIKPALFLEGSAGQVHKEATTLLKATRHCERFILGSGCEIPLCSPVENIKALYRAMEDELETFEHYGASSDETVEVTILPHHKKVAVRRGATLMEAARKSRVAMTSYCDLSGSCGQCVVTVKNGGVEPPGKIESLQLKNRGENQENSRLACQAKIRSDTEIYIPYPSRQFQAKLDLPEELFQISIERELANYGFSPNILARQVERSGFDSISGMSCEQWLELKLPGYMTGLPAIGKFISLAEEKNSGMVAIIDSLRKEVIDFARTKNVYGLAVDISQGAITACVHDLENGKLVCAGSVKSPMISFGLDGAGQPADVPRDPGRPAKLKKKLLEGINRLIAWFHNNHSIYHNQIYDMVIVANPIISHLILGLNPSCLTTAPFTPAVARWVSLSAESLRHGMGLAVNPKCRIEILPGVKGLIGAGAVTGILATRMYDRQSVSIFVNIGEYGEIAIGNAQRLLCAVVSAGPTFGAPEFEPGALRMSGLIHEIKIDSNGKTIYRTFNGLAPMGLTGPSLIDALAEFLRLGIIDRRGHFINTKKWPQVIHDVFVLVPKHKTANYNPICISCNDIADAQKAMSAIRTGISILMEEFGAGQDDIRDVYVSGSTGALINTQNAKRIGLAPDLPSARYTFIKNSAVVGARLAMLSTRARQKASSITHAIERVDLAGREDYSKLFIENMLFPAEK